MKRYVCYAIIIFLFVSLGCAPTKSYYSDLKDQRNQEAVALLASGIALAAEGKHLEAIEELKKAEDIDPSLTEVYLNLSKSYFAVGNYDFAMYYNIKYGEVKKNREITYNYQLF